MEVDRNADEGRITDVMEYVIMRELVEYDGLTLHKRVLEELERAIGVLPREMFDRLTSAKTLSDYEISPAYDAVKFQMRPAGLHDHYRKAFEELSKKRKAGKAE